MLGAVLCRFCRWGILHNLRMPAQFIRARRLMSHPGYATSEDHMAVGVKLVRMSM